jgi:hypothetical protein
VDNSSLSALPPSEVGAPDPITYITPSVVYEAPLEIRAGSGCPREPDPLDLFGLPEN